MSCIVQRGIRFSVIALLAIGVVSSASPGLADVVPVDCYRAHEVTDAYKLLPDGTVPPKLTDPSVREVALEDRIQLVVTDLPGLRQCLEATKDDLVLFVNSQPFPNVKIFDDAGGGNAVNVDLRIVSVAGRPVDPWERLLGSPGKEDVVARVSVGPANGGPIKSSAKLLLDPISGSTLAIWAVAFMTILAIFLVLANRSRLLKNSLVDPEEGDQIAPSYSLARTQAAWWFFFVLAAYLLIGVVTGDFSSSLNGTALILLGIGGATVVAGSIIDNGRNPTLRASVKAKREELKTIDATIAAPPADANLSELNAKRTAMDKELRALRGETTGWFFTDIVSDANGASVARFQVVAWTFVLTGVFVTQTYKGLSMPTFDATLLGLMGISSATYLGLKIGEPTGAK